MDSGSNPQDQKAPGSNHLQQKNNNACIPSQLSSNSNIGISLTGVGGGNISGIGGGAVGILGTSGSGEQLHLPPPSPQLALNSIHNSSNAGNLGGGLMGGINTPSPLSSIGAVGIGGLVNAISNNQAMSAGHFYTSSNNTSMQPNTIAPSNSDFDSDTELSIVAAAQAAAAAAAAATNGYTSNLVNNSNNSTNLSSNNSTASLNAKQQRQQKRRRERAQRLQAERDSRSATNTPNSLNINITGIQTQNNNSQNQQYNNTNTNNVATATTTITGNHLYQASSANSMGEDSNNSSGIFTTSSSSSSTNNNALLPPTDSIASLLLNPPHSPDCHSGLIASPSESEGESLDEDLLSTSSSSTLLLPRDKPPPRPPPPVRRKLPRSPVLEEEIIDGFAILEFKTYEDLEFSIKLGQKRKEKRLSALEELTCTYSIEEIKMPKIIDTGQVHPVRAIGGAISGGNGSIGGNVGNLSNIGVAAGLGTLNLNHNNNIHHKDNMLNENNNGSSMRATPINATTQNNTGSSNNNSTNNSNNIIKVNSTLSNISMNINSSSNNLSVNTDINMTSLTDSSSVDLKSTLAVTTSTASLSGATLAVSTMSSLPWKDTMTVGNAFTTHNGNGDTCSGSAAVAVENRGIEAKILNATGDHGNDSGIRIDRSDSVTTTSAVPPSILPAVPPTSISAITTITSAISKAAPTNLSMSAGSHLKLMPTNLQNSNRNSLAMDASKANMTNIKISEKNTKPTSSMPLLSSGSLSTNLSTTINTTIPSVTKPATAISTTLTPNIPPVTAAVSSTSSILTIPHTTSTIAATTAKALISSTLSTCSVDKLQSTTASSATVAAAVIGTPTHTQLPPSSPYSTSSPMATSSNLPSELNSSNLLTHSSNSDAYKHNSIHSHPGLGPSSFKTMSSMAANCMPGAFNKSNAHILDQKMHNNSSNSSSSNNDFIANMSTATAVLQPKQQLGPTTVGQPTGMDINVNNQKDLHLLHHTPHHHHHNLLNMSGNIGGQISAAHSKIHQQQLQQQQQHLHHQHQQHQHHLQHHQQMQHQQQQQQHQHHHQHLQQQHQQQLQHHHHPHHHHQQQQQNLHKEMLSGGSNNSGSNSGSGIAISGSEHKDRLSDPNSRINNIGKGFNICDSGNDETKASDKLGSIVFPSTPTQQISNATPSPTTPRKSSDYPQQATSAAPSSSVATSLTSTTTTPASSTSSSSIGATANLVQKSCNNEQNSATPLPFPGPPPSSSTCGALSTVATSSIPPSGSTTTGHSHVHLLAHDNRPSSAGGTSSLTSNNNIMMASGSLSSHSIFGTNPPPGPSSIGSEKSTIGPPHSSHMSTVFSSANQVPNDPRNTLTSPSPSGPSPHSQHASSESPFGNKHIADSPSPATVVNHMSPAPLQPSQSNASPLQGINSKSGHPSTQVTANSTSNMQLQPSAQMSQASSGTNVMAGTAAAFNTAGSINNRLGPPPPTLPFPASTMHSNANSQQSLITMKQNEAENRDKSSHGTSVPPPILNGYLPQYANAGVGQHAQNSGASRISPHANAMPSTATPPGPQGISTPHHHQQQQLQTQSSTAGSKLTTTSAASFHSSSLVSSMQSLHPSPSAHTTVTSIAKFANISSSSSSGIPPIQTTAGIFPPGLPPGLPPGVAPPGLMPGGMPPNGISPMLLHSSPYRSPYQNYSLYAPYSGLPHSPYLPPAVPSPSASPRTSRESPMMQQIPKPPSMRPPTPVSQTSNSGHTPGPLGNSSSGSSTPISTTANVPTATPVTSAAANLSQHVLPPTSSIASHMLHHPHLPYPQSLQLQPQILGAPIGPSHHQTLQHSAHSISNATTTTSAPTVLSATLSGGPSGLTPSSPLSRDGTQLLAPPHPHLLGHPHLPPPHMPPLPPHMLPPHPALLRGASPTTPVGSSSANSQTNSAGTTTPTSSTSVIHKGVSPQTESPSKERIDNNVAYLPRSTTTNTHLGGGLPVTSSSSTSSSPYITTSGGGPPLPIPHSVASLAISSNAPYSSTVSMPTTTHASGIVPMIATQLHQPPPANLQYGPGTKGPSIWPSSTSSLPLPPPASVPTTHSSSSMATRPTPPPQVGSAVLAPTISVSPHTPTLHSSSGIPPPGLPPAPTGFHPQYFVPPMPPHPTASSSLSAPVNSISSTNSASSTSASSSTVTTASNSTPVTTTTQSAAPHPFSAESLFQPSKNDQADLLRRELDNRFLDRSGLAVPPSAQQTTHQQPSNSTSGPPAGAPPASPSSSSVPPTSTSGGTALPPGPASQVPSATVPSPYLRQELHHHQHQHTHLHQHQQLLPTALAAAPPPAPAPLFPPPNFKEISKIATVESPFYRTGISLPGYTGYTPAGLIHPGLGGATPFMPPSHLTSFAPKTIQPSLSTNPQQSPQPPLPTNIVDSSSKSIRFTKTGRWNAMHVRIAWEIYYHQNKQNPDKLATAANNSASSGGPTAGVSLSGTNVVVTATATVSQTNAASSSLGAGPSPSAVSAMSMKASPALSLSAAASPHLLHRPGELPPGAAYATALPGRSPFETSSIAASFIGAPPSHIGTAVSPFGRYVGPFGFGISPFGREIPLGGALHDPWRTAALQRTVPYHPAGAPPGWPMKPDTTALDNARREAEEREREREMREREQRERDRQRQREREERERKEKEEKLKREQQEREIRERERERERKERERREMERREMERERILQQQRINESNKMSQAAAAAAAMSSARDRSPHRSVSDMQGGPGGPVGEMRIKEEMPRTKEEQDAILMRASAAAAAADPRYQHQLAQVQASAAAAAHHASFMASRHGPHGVPPPPHLARQMMPPTLGGPPLTHFGPAGPPGWAMDPYRDPYGMSPLRYNSLMEVALRHEEERHKAAMSMYAVQSAAHLRAKEPSPIPPPSGVVGPLGPPPPPHHRLQPGPMGQPQQGPPQSLGGKPPAMGGMPHPMVVDPMLAPKKEDPGVTPVGVMSMAPPQSTPQNAQPGR